MKTATYNDMIRDFASVTDAMNRIFETRPYDYARNGGSNGTPERTVRLPLDVQSSEDGFVVTAYLPGVKSENVEITFEGEELTIRGKFEAVAEPGSVIFSELYHGAFERRLTFNVPVNADAIAATYANGVLTLSVPKSEAIKPKQIKIQSK